MPDNFWLTTFSFITDNARCLLLFYCMLFVICQTFQLLFSFQEFRYLLDDNLELLVKLRDLIIDWVQEGFQEFFQKLHGRFLVLSGRSNNINQDSSLSDSIQMEKVPTGLVLVLAQLCVFVEQSAIPRVTEVLDYCNLMKFMNYNKL